MSIFTEQIKAAGIADTRAFSIEMAFQRLHESLCQMDKGNIKRFNELFPGVAKATNQWAATEAFTRAVRES
tara:strand:+ start:467 stop:679 length:213 start_codon:yes stop_codon:yes gene_type:complete